MSKRILLIEDSEQDRKIITRFLNKVGYEDIVLAETGEDGVRKALSDVFDLVITDTMLPGINSFEVCDKIREKYDADSLKIIIMTGQLDAVDAVKAGKSGANDYCAKTSDFVALLTAVKNLLIS